MSDFPSQIGRKEKIQEGKRTRPADDTVRGDENHFQTFSKKFGSLICLGNWNSFLLAISSPTLQLFSIIFIITTITKMYISTSVDSFALPPTTTPSKGGRTYIRSI